MSLRLPSGCRKNAHGRKNHDQHQDIPSMCTPYPMLETETRFAECGQAEWINLLLIMALAPPERIQAAIMPAIGIDRKTPNNPATRSPINSARNKSTGFNSSASPMTLGWIGFATGWAMFGKMAVGAQLILLGKFSLCSNIQNQPYVLRCCLNI